MHANAAATMSAAASINAGMDATPQVVMLKDLVFTVLRINLRCSAPLFPWNARLVSEIAGRIETERSEAITIGVAPNVTPNPLSGRLQGLRYARGRINHRSAGDERGERLKRPDCRACLTVSDCHRGNPCPFKSSATVLRRWMFRLSTTKWIVFASGYAIASLTAT